MELSRARKERKARWLGPMTRKEERKTISPSTSFPKNPHHQQQQQKTKKQAELGTEDDFSPSSSRSSSSSSSNAATTAATAAAAAARKIFIPKHGVGIRVEQLYKRYDPLRAGGDIHPRFQFRSLRRDADRAQAGMAVVAGTR